MSIKRFFQYKRTKVGNKFAPDPWHVNVAQWLVKHGEALFIGSLVGAAVMYLLQKFI